MSSARFRVVGARGPRLAILGSSGLALALVAGALGASPTAGVGGPTVITGTRSGPISIPVMRRKMAALRLPAGGWFVTAKAQLRSIGGVGSAHLGVSCRLDLGARSDVVLAAPVRKKVSGSRVPILLTLAGRLSSPGKAILSCVGEVGDTVAIELIRMTGIRAGRLTTSSGAGESTTGYGKPRIISWSSPKGRPRWREREGDGAFHKVVDLSLPAGDWWVVARAVLRPKSTGRYDCQLSSGLDYDDISAGISASGWPGDTVPVALQVVHHQATSGSLSLFCRSGIPTPEPFQVGHVAVTAVKAGRLTNRFVGNGGESSWGTGSPRIISGWQDESMPAIPYGSSWGSIASLSLPAGRWTVLAKLWVTATGIPSDTTERLVRCRIAFGSRYDAASIQYANNVTADAAPLVMSLAYSSVEPGPVELRCRRNTPTGTVTAHFYKVTAMKLRSLSVKPL